MGNEYRRCDMTTLYTKLDGLFQADNDLPALTPFEKYMRPNKKKTFLELSN